MSQKKPKLTAFQKKQRKKYYNVCAKARRKTKREAKELAAKQAEQSKRFDIANWDADRPAVREALEWGGLVKITFYKG